MPLPHPPPPPIEARVYSESTRTGLYTALAADHYRGSFMSPLTEHLNLRLLRPSVSQSVRLFKWSVQRDRSCISALEKEQNKNG
jgi:hypothetical protein